MPAPSRKELKDAMLALFGETDPLKKKALSQEFTRLLFRFVDSLSKSKGEAELNLLRMQAVGAFSNYVFRKQKEKTNDNKKSAIIFREIAGESDELLDEIESLSKEQG